MSLHRLRVRHIIGFLLFFFVSLFYGRISKKMDIESDVCDSVSVKDSIMDIEKREPAPIDHELQTLLGSTIVSGAGSTM